MKRIPLSGPWITQKGAALGVRPKMTANTPVSPDVSPRGINLPLAHYITEGDVDYVSGALRAILKL